MSLCILSPGPLTTVQDLGRDGSAAQGFRHCGAADGYSARLANLLVGNNPDDALLETTLRGPELRFLTDAVFALAGAEADADLDGHPVPFYTPCFAPADSTLRLGTARTGLRSYLALWGGIAVPPVRGSRSTDLSCHLGGFSGRALRAGDVLPLARSGREVTDHWARLCDLHLNRPLGDKQVCHGGSPWRQQGDTLVPLLRAVAGPQSGAFTDAARDTFVRSIYQLTPDCNRMACKLEGPSLETLAGSDILSDGIVEGSVQVAGNGQPIVMLADHQTTGGYAKIATVISADLPALAQLRPGQAVAFDWVSPARAVAVARQRDALLHQVKERLP